MKAELIGNYELDGNYGSRYRLPDGTDVNVVTYFTGPGLGTDTEVEASRKLTDAEETAVLDADATNDHATGPRTEYAPLPVQSRF